MPTIISGTNGVNKVEDGAITYADLSNEAISKLPFGGFKNYIIDGRFDFWYEGTSQTSSGYGSDTMWVNANIGSTKTHSRQSFAVGETFSDGTLAPQYYSRTVVSSVAGASNNVQKRHKIEDVTRLAGKTVTISFYAKADSIKNIAIELCQSFGTGGAPSATVTGIGSQKIALTTTWTKYTATITIPSISGKTLGTDGVNTSYTEVNIWFDAGSDYDTRTASLGQQSGTFDIAMVQLEEGSVATEFQNIPIGIEGIRVSRYYETGKYCWKGSNTTIGHTMGGQVSFNVTKRAIPTVTTASAGDTGFAGATLTNSLINIKGFRHYRNAISVGNADYDTTYIADARL